MQTYTSKVALGDTAKDEITGYKGVVIAVTFWINNCERATLQARGLKDGKPHESVSFDVPSLTVTQRATPPRPQVQTGGPMPEPVRR